MFRFVLPGGGILGGGGGGGQSLPASTPLPTESDAEIKRKEDESNIAASKRKGLLSTNLTAGADLGETDAETTRATLGDGAGG